MHFTEFSAGRLFNFRRLNSENHQGKSRCRLYSPLSIERKFFPPFRLPKRWSSCRANSFWAGQSFSFLKHGFVFGPYVRPPKTHVYVVVTRSAHGIHIWSFPAIWFGIILAMGHYRRAWIATHVAGATIIRMRTLREAPVHFPQFGEPF